MAEAGPLHPLIQICKNGNSGFAENALNTIKAKSGGEGLDWSMQDELMRTPLMLAALHGNMYLVR